MDNVMHMYDIQYTWCVPLTVKDSNIMVEILEVVVITEEAAGNNEMWE
jgi:hypothetical protein